MYYITKKFDTLGNWERGKWPGETGTRGNWERGNWVLTLISSFSLSSRNFSKLQKKLKPGTFSFCHQKFFVDNFKFCINNLFHFIYYIYL